MPKIIEISLDLPNDPSKVDSGAVVREISDALKKFSDLKDFKAAIQEKPDNPKAEPIIKKYPRPSLKNIPYKASNNDPSRAQWIKPTHDLAEIARAIDTESYLARSIDRHKEIALKEGWQLIGKDKEVVDYVRQRLFEFSAISGIPIEDIFAEALTNLIQYHTALLAINREPTKSTGRRIRLHGKELDPIAGVFPLDVTSTWVEQNDSGRPIRWKQDTMGRNRIHDADDVISITVNKKTGYVFGTPYVIPVLDDIKALRRLEELSELVAHKFLFPLLHHVIGTTEAPAGEVEDMDGRVVSEIEIARMQIEAMPTEGGIVTSERHEIKLIGAEGKVLDLKPYLEHFEARVLGGLRLSGADIGRGDTSNRGTATTIAKNLIDAVRAYQKAFADSITCKLLDILVLEGGFDLSLDTRVYLKFPSPDRDELRAQQNHGLVLFQSNAITLDEFRRDYLSLDDMTDEELADTYFALFEKPVIDAQLAAKAATAKSSGSDAARSKNMPSNQFGTLFSSPSVPKNDYSLKKEYTDSIKSMWYSSLGLIEQDNGVSNMITIMERFCNEVCRSSKSTLLKNIDIGVSRAADSAKKPKPILPNALYDVYLSKIVRSDLQKICKKIIIHTGQKDIDNATITSLFDTLWIELRILMAQQYDTSYAFGFIEACKIMGYDRIFVRADNGKVLDTININSISVRDMFNSVKEGTYLSCNG